MSNGLKMAKKTTTKKEKVVKALEKSPRYQEILDRYLQLHNTITKAKFYRLYVKDFVPVSEPAFNYWARKIDKEIAENFKAYLKDYAYLEVEKRAKEKMLAASMTELAKKKIEEIIQDEKQQKKLGLKDVLTLYKLSKDIEAQDKSVKLNEHETKRKDYILFLFRNLILAGKLNEEDLNYLENETDKELQGELQGELSSARDVQLLSSSPKETVDSGFTDVPQG